VQAIRFAWTRHGVDAHSLLRDAQIDEAALHDPQGRIPVRQTTHLWQLAEAATGNPCLGLLVASHTSPGSFQAISLSLLSSSSLHEMLGKFVRYSPLLVGRPAMRLEQTRSAVKVYLDADQGPDAPPWSAVDAMMCLVSCAGRLLHGPGLRPLEVQLRRPKPAQHASSFSKAFNRAPVMFQAPNNVIVFDRTVADARLTSLTPSVSPFHAELLSQLEGATEGQALLSRVRALLIERLPEGEPSHARIAQALQISVRSLQRHLAEAGTSYRELLQQIRLQQARTLLADVRISISEIAFQLGFRDASTFAHAFRRWTGTSPSEWRRQCH